MGQTREQLLDAANASIERLRQEAAQGIDQLPAKLHAAVIAAPDGYQWSLGRILFNLKHAPGRGDFARGLALGQAYGLISAGHAFGLFDNAQFDALNEFVRELQPVKS